MKKDWIARELTIEIIVGAFMVMIFLGLGYFTIILSREAWFGQKRVMEVVFNDVMGLSEGDSVVARGMPVGKVRALELDPAGGVRVELALDQPLKVRTDYRITIVATSILGGRYLHIHEGSEQHPPVTQGMVFRGREPYDLMADAAELVNAVKEALMEGGTIENLRETAEQIKETVTRLNSGQGTLGRLLSKDDTLYEDFAAGMASMRKVAGRLEKGEGTVGKFMADDGKVYEDLSSAVASLRTVADRLEKGEGTLGKLMTGNETLYDDLSATAASLRKISDRIEKGEGMLGKLASDDEKVYDDLSATVASLKKTAERIEKGEGLLGSLIQDDNLSGEVREIINEVHATIDDIRETTPVVTFTSILFGAF